jgi:hypothetical protein
MALKCVEGKRKDAVLFYRVAEELRIIGISGLTPSNPTPAIRIYTVIEIIYLYRLKIKA